MIVLKHVRRALAAAGSALAGGVLAQTTQPIPEFVHPPPARAAQLDAGDPSCQPAYPPAALAARVRGESHLTFQFDAHGKLVSVKGIHGADATPEQRAFDLAAAKSLAACPFTPGVGADGKAVGGDIVVTFRWEPAPASSAREGRIAAPQDCRPEYPLAALRTGAQGRTRLAFHLDEMGKVLAVDVVQSAGDTPQHRLLDSAAAHALATCRFEPQRDADGKAVPGVVTLTYSWHLE